MTDLVPDDDWPTSLVAAPEITRQALLLSRQLRRFLNLAAAMRPSTELTGSLTRDLETWSDRLESNTGTEDESVWRMTQRNEPPALLPSLTFIEDGQRLNGNVTFGRFHVGRGAVHGGAISLVFDEAMGALAGSAGRRQARTAYLHVDYRAPTPLDKALRLQARIDAEEGRKRFMKASIVDGEVVCAEAHGLWVELRPMEVLAGP